MARPKGSLKSTPPKHCFHKASGRGYVTIAGAVIYTGRWETSGRVPRATPEADERYRRAVAEWATHKGLSVENGSDPTIAEVVAAYLPHKLRNSTALESTGHLNTVRRSLGVLTGLYATLPAKAFGPSQFRACQTRMMQLVVSNHGKTRGMPLSRGYINEMLTCIKTMFRWAKVEGVADRAPFDAIRDMPLLKYGTAREPKAVRAVADSVVDATLPFLNAHIAAMVRLQRLIGCRGQEICLLRLADIDITPTSETSRAACKRCAPGAPCNFHLNWVFKPRHHKTAYKGSILIYKIGPEAQRVLTPFLKNDPEAFLFAPAEMWGNKRKSLSRKPYIDSGTYAEAIKAGALRADTAAHLADPEVPEDVRIVPHWHPHQLRHAHATRVDERYGPTAASKALGHASVETTRRYIDPNTRELDQIAAEIG